MNKIITKINKYKNKIKTLLTFFLFGLLLISFILTTVLSYAYFYEIPRWKIIEYIPNPLRLVIDAIRNAPYLIYIFKSSNLPVYNLYIDSKNYEKLNKTLPNAFNVTLSAENKISVPAKFVYNNTAKDIKVKYRGDKYTHWAFKKKSWGLKFNENDLFDGTSEIKLIIPDDRGYIGEYFNNYRAEKLNLAAPSDKFVILKVNNGPSMIYYQIEDWNEYFLEKYFNTAEGDLYGEKNLEDEIFDSIVFWKKYVSTAEEKNNYGNINHLINLIKEADDKKFKTEIVNLVDMNNFYNWQIHSMLSGSAHQDDMHNMRLFFNKEKGKFFLIPWDVGIENYNDAFNKPRFADTDFYNLDVEYNPLVTRMLKIDEFYLERNRRLWNYVKQEDNLKEDLKFYDETLENIKSALYNDVLKFNRNAAADATIKYMRQNLETNYYFLRNQLDKAEIFVMISSDVNSYTPLTFDFKYISASPINFKGFLADFDSLKTTGNLRLYEDSNLNDVFDRNDTMVADLTYKNNDLLLLDKSNKLFYPDRTYAGKKKQIALKLASKKFFLVSNIPLTINLSSISFNFINEISGSKINPQIQFNK